MEVKRNPTPPTLNKRAVKLLTELCFRKNDALQKVDGLFVYSTSIEIQTVSKLIEKILNQGLTKKVFLTGGQPPKEVAKDLQVDGRFKEADLVFNALHQDKFSDVSFFVERKSSNTLGNVTESLKNPEFNNCQSLIFIFKSHAAGRGYLTLRKFFQSATILQQSYDTKYKRAGKIITRNSWNTFDFGRNRVWGEFLRIKTYGERGDIEYGSVKDSVAQIEKEI